MGDELPVESKSAALVERAKAILMQPKAEWARIAGETTEPAKLLTSYALPLAAIGPIAGLLGGQLFGYRTWWFSYRPSLLDSIVSAVGSYVMAIVGLLFIAFVANFLSPKFGGKDNWPAAFRLAAYSLTAYWVAGVFGIIPTLGVLIFLAALYGLYLFYLGATPVLGVPEDKTIGYTAAVVGVVIAVGIVLSTIWVSVYGSMALVTGAAVADERATIDLGELGNVTVDGANQTVDLGELGRVEIDGDTATVTVDGQTVEVDTAALEAQAEAARAAAAE
jgi:MFS family permease